MSIQIKATGSFVDVLVTQTLTKDDLPILFDAFYAARRRGPFVMLTDTLGLESTSPAVVPGFAEGLRRIPDLKRLWLGDAVVVASPIARFVLSALMMAAPIPTTIRVFEDRLRAKEWCRALLAEARVPVPHTLREPTETTI